MDYKEKYEQALEVAQRFYNNSVAITKKGLEDIFPELAESEDERIRKALIKIVNGIYQDEVDYAFVEDGISYEQLFSWLEKQAEHARFREAIQVGDQVTKNEDGVLVNLSQLSRVAKKDEKQGEQKPAEWSEEDESHIRYLIECLEHCKKGVSLTMTAPTAQEYIDWLKFLRPQPQWKPSDEHYELEEFAKIVRSNLTGISKAVQKLFETKYLQLTGNKMYRGFKD